MIQHFRGVECEAFFAWGKQLLTRDFTQVEIRGSAERMSLTWLDLEKERERAVQAVNLW